MDLHPLIRTVPDFPEAGVLFRDITPLLAHPEGLTQAVAQLAHPFRSAGVELVLGIESRGFVFGAPVAQALGAGFVPLRKPGKLPGPTRRAAYTLEYGEAALEIHEDALRPGQRVLICDDVLATGGTLGAALTLAREGGAHVVGATVLMELPALGGRQALEGESIHAVLQAGP